VLFKDDIVKQGKPPFRTDAQTAKSIVHCVARADDFSVKTDPRRPTEGNISAGSDEIDTAPTSRNAAIRLVRAAVVTSKSLRCCSGRSRRLIRTAFENMPRRSRHCLFPTEKASARAALARGAVDLDKDSIRADESMGG